MPRGRVTDVDRRRVERPLWRRVRATIAPASARALREEILLALVKISSFRGCQTSGVAEAVLVRAGVSESSLMTGAAGGVLLLDDEMRDGDVDMVGVAVPIGAKVE